MVYLSRWLGMCVIVNIESLFGIQSTLGHLVKVIMIMWWEKVKIILSEFWYYVKIVWIVVDKVGVIFIWLFGDVGVVGINSYVDYME